MSRWAQVRAVLVAVHLAAITLSALPSPEGGLNRSTWADPTVQTEFTAWAKRFGMPEKAFEDQLWVFAEAYSKGYGRLLTPVRPYENLVGSEQSWKMFVAPHRFPSRLQLSARGGAGQEWEVLFEEGSPTATWHAPMLRLERLRSAIFRWSWPNYQTAWAHACTALARLAFSERDELTEVRCRFHKARSPSPEEVAAGTQDPGSWVYTRIVKRGPDGLPMASVAAEPPPAEVGAAPPLAPSPAGAAQPTATPALP